MKPLSEQIRSLIRNSSTSSYAIGREARIDKSTMSRFMNGGTLTLEKLDRLGQQLGVLVTVEASRTPLPLEIGRPRTKRSRAEMTKEKAVELANHFAKLAYDEHFSSRRGVWHVEDLDCIIVYNNNPFTLDADLRRKEMNRVSRRLRRMGLNTLARGKAGSVIEGRNECYTSTLLLDGGRDRLSNVWAIVDEEACEAIAEHSELHLKMLK